LSFSLIERMPYHNVWRAALLAALVVVLAGLACDPFPLVRWENTTSQRVLVYEDGESAFDLEPHECKKIVSREKGWLSDIKVVAEDGRVLLEDHISWEELKHMDYKIVITDPLHPPSPSPTPTGGG
jgi:hypothetical protein